MSLGNALSVSLSGLRFTSLATTLVGANVANAGTPGYVKKRIDAATDMAGEAIAGIRPGLIVREYDAFVQRQLQGERANGAYADTRSSFLARVDQLFGAPGSPTALDTVLNSFNSSLQDLSSSPESFITRATVASRGAVLAQTLRGLSDQVQAMRADAERGLADAVTKVNNILGRLQQVNVRLSEGAAATDGRASLLDQRDQLVSELSEHMDVKVSYEVSDAVRVVTGNGTSLLQSSQAVLVFDGRTTLLPGDLYSTDPSRRGVGTIALTSGAGTTDLLAVNAFASGRIAALVELRDKTLVAVQSQLDEVAAALAQALGTRQASAEVTLPGPGPSHGFDMALGTPGLQDGDTITMTLVAGGQTQRFTFKRIEDLTVSINDAITPDPADRVFRLTGASAGGYAAGMQAAIDVWSATVGAPAGTFSVSASGQTLRVLSDRAVSASRVEEAIGNVTETSLTAGGPAMPFFTDAGTVFTDSLSGTGSQRLGLAARIDVNGLLKADPSRLVVMSTSPRTPDGEPARPAFLRDAMSRASRFYAPSGSLGTPAAPFSGSIGDYARAVIASQGADALRAKDIAEGQKLVLTQLQARFDQSSQVNIDEEMTRLITLQNAYGANARVMSTVREMFDVLRQM